MRLDAPRALRCSATLLGFLLAFQAAPLRAQGVLTRQRPVLRSPGRLPLGVPPGYMLTRGGFFHPSCVVTLHADETLGEDRVIRGLDGREHTRLAPCTQPRFNAAGALLPALAATPAAPSTLLKAAPVHAPAYDGWIISYVYAGSVKPGTSVKLSTDVIVPSAPLKVGAQDVAFFNSIETSTKGGDILQPVLDFGGYGKNWAIESEHCCVDDNDMQSDPVEVAAGDLIRGVVTGTNCDAKGACTAWTVVTTDVTSNQTTTLNTNIATGAMNEINPAVLETYDVSSCDMLPANGEITYFNHHVTKADGQELQFSYDFVKDDAMTATFPTTCGYRGEHTGGEYTLIFGANPSSAGGASAGGAAGAAAGGSSSTVGGAAGTMGGAGGVSVAGAGGTSGWARWARRRYGCGGP